MKLSKFLFPILSLFIWVGCSSNDEDVDDVQTIPIEDIQDKDFQTFLLEQFDTDKDGTISLTEAMAVKNIYCAYQTSITSLEGIEYFPALETLDCTGTKITSIDISKNEALKELIIDNTLITDLDFVKNTPLKRLSCRYTPISSLDIRETKIEEINCTGCQEIKSINAKGNQYLKKMECKGVNPITIDVSESSIEEFYYYGERTISIFLTNCKNLKEIKYSRINNKDLSLIYGAGLISIDLTGCSSLTRFRANMIEQINLTDCNNLKELECIGTFQSLDLSSNNALEHILLHSYDLQTIDTKPCPELKELDCSAGIEEIDLSKNNKIERLTCIAGHLSSLDVSQLPRLKYLKYGHFITYSTLDLTQNQELEELILESSSKLIGDYGDYNLNVNAQNLSSLKKVKEISHRVAEINLENCKNLEEIEIKNNNYKPHLSKLNIQGCSSLRKIKCENTKLESLDISDMPLLDSLDISSEIGLTELKVNKNLSYLNCRSNRLTSLDVEDRKNLTVLNCDRNQIQRLKTKGCSKLSQIECYGNEISTLDLDGLTELTELDCGGNKIKELSLTSCTQLTRLYCNYNELSQLDVSKNSALEALSCVGNPNLTQLYLNTKHQISQLTKDKFTSIVLVD